MGGTQCHMTGDLLPDGKGLPREESGFESRKEAPQTSGSTSIWKMAQHTPSGGQC